jgi:fibronectin-binding autotransporter adhesin
VDAGQTLFLTGHFWGTASRINFSGPGTMMILQGQTYMGPTTINSGVFQIGNGGTVGSINSNNIVQIGSTGLLRFNRSNVLTLGRQIVDIAGQNGNISQDGAGTTILTHNDNSYSGSTTVNAGTLQIGNGTSGNLTQTSGVTLAAGTTLALNMADGAVFDRVVSGDGGLTKNGASNDNILGAANTYTGPTLVAVGTLSTSVANAIPTASAVTVNNGATLGLGNVPQTLSGGLTVNGTLNLGGNTLTLSGGSSSIAAITGSGTIVVGPGAMLTLPAGINNAGVNIELAGGTLSLGGNPYTLGALSVTAPGSVLDYASVGGTSATFGSVGVSLGAALSVTNWTPGSDLLSAASVVGDPPRNSMNQVPLNRITFAGYAATDTNWRIVADEITPIPPNPFLSVAVVSNAGVGGFGYNLAGLSAGSLVVTTATPGVPAVSAQLAGSTGVAATITQSGVPVGWPALPVSATCVDAMGASNGNGTDPFGSLAGTVLSVPANRMIAGADITCTFTNNLGTVISGRVFNDGGAPSGGMNSGTPNNGVLDGAEAGLAGLTVSLTDCATTTHASTSTSSTGAYTLNVPSAQNGQPVCVAVTLPGGQLATGASVGSTPTPDGSATDVGGVVYTYSRSALRLSFTAPSSGTLALNFGLVPVSTWVANNSVTAVAGGVGLHSHRFTAGTGGELTIASGTGTSSPTGQTGWEESYFLDSGCTGALSGVAAPISGSIPVLQGDEVCVLMRQQVPGGAINGNSYTVPVQAQLALTGANPGLSVSYSVTNVTTVSGAAVTLYKQVRNLTTGSGWSTGNNAARGDELEYQITFTNTSASPVTEVVINDGTTAWTTWTGAWASSVPAGLTCAMNTPGNPAPAAAVPCSPAHNGSGKGNLTWTFTGSLQPLATGTLNFTVTVD